MKKLLAVKARLVHGHIQRVLDDTGMTQRELAKALGIGYTMLNGYYTLRKRPGQKTAEKIALFAGCTAEEVIIPVRSNTTSVMYKEMDELLISDTTDVYALPDTKELEYSGPPFEEVITQLPESYQHILTELFVNDKRASDVARELGITRTAVMFKKNNALKKLKRMYKDTRSFERE